MKDSDALIFQAFLAALTQLDSALPDAVQSQLNQIAAFLDSDRLEEIAEEYPPLKSIYEDAHGWLFKHGNQQRKGLDTIPDASWQKENTASLTLDNTSKKSGDSTPLTDMLPNIQEGLKNNEELVQITKQVCQSSDSVDSAKVALFGYIQIA
ncbi:hypothetical protein NG799_07260 [Laspinema sp. D1]|uniref:Uncharacterized protein n=1 Tax=Laspinema palackyanum D2a TaxID=2953684 RepID=A0ABT2MN26_9CYAN|nr:hypothetical protein [Laspinema sp. D2a]